MSCSNCCFLTCIPISQESSKVVWYSLLFQNFPQFIVIHTVKGIGVVNKAEVDGFLEFSCFFHDPADVGNLIYGSLAFSKSSLNIWAFWALLCQHGLLQSYGHCWVFQICWYIEYSSLIASTFRIWNSSAGFLSPPLALFLVMFSKAHLTCTPGCLALGEWSQHCGYLGH